MSDWARKRRRDPYYRRAKDEGYPSRAAYKLLQINERYRLFHAGDRVLDLGCAPGGWSLAARQIVGAEGKVVGVDLEETPPVGYDNVHFLVGDITEDSTVDAIRRVQSEYDAIISDASPRISGMWSRDHLISIDLATRAVELCDAFLREGGSFAAKVFQGEELANLHRSIRSRFSFTKRSKPKASRGESSEIYLVGRGFRRKASEEADRV